MHDPLIELQVYYEIAMSIGNSLILQKMLNEALPMYIRKLNCSAGLIFKRNLTSEPSLSRYQLISSIPRNFKNNAAVLNAIAEIIRIPVTDDVDTSDTDSIPYISQDELSYNYHIFILEDFGLLVLIKRGQQLDKNVVKSLNLVNQKLAKACVACEQNEINFSINKRLHEENKRRKDAEESLLNTLHDKEVLLKEIHHRVKNNLAIINSIIHLQSEGITDIKTSSVFREIENRIYSIALVHEHLYKETKLESINFRNYLELLSNQILRTFAYGPELIATSIKMPKLFFDINTAIPLGLIFTELLTNALKYSFAGNKSGTIYIYYEEKDGLSNLIIWNTGIGFPEDFSLKSSSSLGLRLVRALVTQISGSIEITDHSKTRIEIHLPKYILKTPKIS